LARTTATTPAAHAAPTTLAWAFLDGVVSQLFQLVLLQGSDGLTNGSTGARVDLDSGFAEELGGVRAQLAGDQHLGPRLRDHLRGLDSRPFLEIPLCRVVQIGDFPAPGVEEDEAGSSAKTRIHLAVEGFSSRTDTDLHDLTSLQ
jgi:hypothetical protein